MKKILSVLAVAALVAGCKAPPKRVVRIESDPAGMRVFYGDGANEDSAKPGRAYVGMTPCEFTPAQDDEARFDRSGIFLYTEFVQTAHIFWCEPPPAQTNLFPKRQVFHGAAVFQPADKVPEKIFFDLTTP